jgi:hypothetical protein
MTRARDVSSRGGMTQVIPTSTTITGSGSASVTANGAVNFTNVTTISLNNCFIPEFANYKIVMNVDKSTDNGGVVWRLRSAGSDSSAGSYLFAGRRNISWGGASADMLYSTTYFPITDYNNGASSRSATIDIINPKASQFSQMHESCNYTSSNGFYGNFHGSGAFRGTDSFDGFTFYFSDASSSTGSIRVYGYNNG